MVKRIVVGFLYFQIFLFTPVAVLAQPRTVGLFVNDTTRAWRGYTLMAPNKYTAAYLINNEGRLIHRWSRSTHSPGNSVYLLPNGNLLRSCKTQGYFGTGEGGRIEEYDWNDSLVWQFDYSTPNYISHHDIKALPNGNVLLLAIEKKTLSQVLAAGFDSSKFQPDIVTNGYMLPDYVIEVQPTRPVGGIIVWEWHVWDHLIQDFDSTKENYGVVADHPELVDADGDGRRLKSFWNHMNSINYNPTLDQIILSVRGNSELWVIDHSTTTAEAAGHTGGRYGRGGDLLYRWGNPVCYRTGNAGDQKLFQQHDAEWIDSTSPGAGDILVFNNGVGRNYSSVDQFTPPMDSLGNYLRTAGTAFGPTSLTWTYTGTPPSSFFGENISGSQRLPNGNTMICIGPSGTLLEVTSSGQTVWKYVNPVTNTGPLGYNDSIPPDPTHAGTYQNMVFKVQKYAPTYEGFLGRDLTPGEFIELYPTGVEDGAKHPPGSFELFQNYPNPFNPSTTISFSIPRSAHTTLTIFNALGQEIATPLSADLTPGTYSTEWNPGNAASGVYYCRLRAGGFTQTKTLILMK